MHPAPTISVFPLIHLSSRQHSICIRRLLDSFERAYSPLTHFYSTFIEASVVRLLYFLFFLTSPSSGRKVLFINRSYLTKEGVQASSSISSQSNMADMTQQQIAQLPNLAEALPPPPAFIQNEKSVLTTWDFVNSLYKELAEVPERQFNLMNKVRRAIAPGLLIGLQLIFQYSLSEIEKIAPGTLATRVPSLDGRATQWAQAGAEAIARAKRVRLTYVTFNAQC